MRRILQVLYDANHTPLSKKASSSCELPNRQESKNSHSAWSMAVTHPGQLLPADLPGKRPYRQRPSLIIIFGVRRTERAEEARHVR